CHISHPDFVLRVTPSVFIRCGTTVCGDAITYGAFVNNPFLNVTLCDCGTSLFAGNVTFPTSTFTSPANTADSSELRNRVGFARVLLLPAYCGCCQPCADAPPPFSHATQLIGRAVVLDRYTKMSPPVRDTSAVV